MSFPTPEPEFNTISLRGYLVVEQLPNQQYRGLARGPFWSANDTFDHAALFTELNEFLDGDMLAATREAAGAAQAIYDRVLGRETELLYVQTADHGSEPLANEAATLLGVDVSSPAPFVSLLSGQAAQFSLANMPLNEHGLLASVEEANTLITQMRRQEMIHEDDGFMPWYIFRLV